MSALQLQASLLTAVPALCGDAWLNHAKNSINKYVNSYTLHPFTFQITSYGFRQHTGWITVFNQDTPYWNLIFTGCLLDKSGENIERILTFLTSAICSIEPSRIRGPEEYMEDTMRYRSAQLGSFEDFEGREWIEIGKQVVYRGTFHGGLIR